MTAILKRQKEVDRRIYKLLDQYEYAVKMSDFKGQAYFERQLLTAIVMVLSDGYSPGFSAIQAVKKKLGIK